MSQAVLEKKVVLPAWLRQEIPDARKLKEMRVLLRAGDLRTVCESARCPNSGKCLNAGVVTVMILGHACTRKCGFCAVEKGAGMPANPAEPENVARLVEELGLRYVVVTSVTRDDLPDGGAGHFARTVRAIRARRPETKVEILIPDFGGVKENLEKVIAARPDVIGHNVEMVSRLFPALRPQADYARSLNVLRSLKGLCGGIVKSGFMVGLGETDDEIKTLFADLAQSGCDLLTVGQYLAPSRDHAPVARFVPPQDFVRYQKWGEAAGIPCVTSGPLVRSSYLAEESYQELLKKGKV